MAEASVQLLRMETPVADVVRASGVQRVKVINPPRENLWPGKDVLGRWENDAFDGECLSYAAGAGLDGEWTFANDDATGAVVLRRVEEEPEPEPEPGVA